MNVEVVVLKILGQIIYSKVCLLLQNHTDNQYGLWFKPGTHKQGVDSKEIHLNSECTDLIIFDQEYYTEVKSIVHRMIKFMARIDILLLMVMD